MADEIISQESATASSEEPNLEPSDGAVSVEELQAKLTAQEAELEKLRTVLHNRNQEAAEKRIKARDAETKAKTLEEQVRELQAKFDAQQAEAKLNRVIAEHGLSPTHAPLLGDNPDAFEEKAKLIKEVMEPSKKPQDGAPQPLGVERLKGGIEPSKDVDTFDPQAIIARHRRGR